MSDDRDAVPVATVTGRMSSSELGMVLPHEHLVCDISPSYAPVGDPEIDERLTGPVGPELAWLLSQYPYNSRDNCRMDDLDAVLDELRGYRAVGGGTVVDLTTPHEGRSPDTLRELSDASGIRIVMGSGWYLESSESERMRSADVDALTGDLVDDFRESAVPPGVIGEIGVSPAFTEAEHRSLRAAAQAQREVGVPLFVHLPGWQRHGDRVLDIVLDEMHVPPDAVVLCHMDPSGNDREYQHRLAVRGVFLEFDMIGMPYFYRGAGEGQSPSPDTTAAAVVALLERGHEDRILLSHDMGIKSMLSRNGGNGLRFVPMIFPDHLRRAGCDLDVRDRLQVRNPRHLFEAAAHGARVAGPCSDVG